VDLIGSAVIYTAGASHSGVSVEINVSYLDAAFLDVTSFPSFLNLLDVFLCKID